MTEDARPSRRELLRLTAGQAARQIVQDGTTFADVDTDKLRRELGESGAIVSWRG